MGPKLQFGKTYKAYGIVDGKIEEYDVKLAKISHYRNINDIKTVHYVGFWVIGDKEGYAWLSNLRSRPTSLPTGYLMADFNEKTKVRLITFDRELLGGGEQ